MAEKIICPKCKRASYIADQIVFASCPFCDFMFSWGKPDRRVFERIRKEVPATLELNGEFHVVKTKDVSERGIGIIIDSNPFVKKGDQIRCKIGENDEMTKVVWTLESKEKQRIGLLFI